MIRCRSHPWRDGRNLRIVEVEHQIDVPVTRRNAICINEGNHWCVGVQHTNVSSSTWAEILRLAD